MAPNYRTGTGTLTPPVGRNNPVGKPAGPGQQPADKPQDFQEGKWEGIEAAIGLHGYVRELQNSKYHPGELMKSIECNLDFLGHGASKWTDQRESLKGMLDRIQHNQGKARFLLLNPACEVCARASLAFHGDASFQPKKILESLVLLRHVQNRYRNIEFKLYNHTPQFRLAFLDKKEVIVGHYKAYEKDSKDSPLMIFTPQQEWSFYKAFWVYFNDEWEKAIDFDCDEIAELYHHYFQQQFPCRD